MKPRHFLLIAPIFIAIAILNGLLTSASSDDQMRALTVDGAERTYALHIPKGFDSSKPAPLLIALHGRLGTGEGEEKLAHFHKESDEHGFLVVYPDGLQRSWADGRGATPSDQKNVDDVKFISALIDNLSSKYKIDPARIYAAGMSNGGFMAGRLACDLSDRISAVAIVGASLPTEVAASCHPAKPVSVMIVQGTDDPLVPIEGGALRRDGKGGTVLSHDDSIRKWLALDQCATTPQKDAIPDSAGDGTSIRVETYAPCFGGSEVRSYVVVHGGHTWPGGQQYLPAALIGETTRNLNGSEVIWDFLAHHSR
jgi:polyhydroxybutyrate depolymerase